MTTRGGGASQATERTWALRRDGLVLDVHDGGPSGAGGEPVVLLHGFPGSALTWAGVAPPLRAAGMRTLALDQRGYSPGARPRPVRAYRLDELAADVLALADDVGARRFHVVGHDWGGFVAWYLAAHHPGRLATATVLSTPHPRALAASMVIGLQALRSTYVAAFQIPMLPEAVLTAGGGALMRAALTSSGLDTATADAYVDRLAGPGAMRSALHWYRAAVRHPGPIRSIGTIRVPTSYVWSTHDQALGAAAAHRTADHVGGPYRFTVLEGVPHWIPEVEPARAAELILDHVGGR